MATKTQALDHLIDALAGQDVPVKGSTGTVIDQLATMIENGAISLGGGYDLALKFDTWWLWSAGEIEITTGSYAEASAKLLAGKPLNVAAFGENASDEGNPLPTTFGVAAAYLDTYVVDLEDRELVIWLSQVDASSVYFVEIRLDSEGSFSIGSKRSIEFLN